MEWLTFGKMVLYTGAVSLVLTLMTAFKPGGYGDRYFPAGRRRQVTFGRILGIWTVTWALMVGLGVWLVYYFK